MSKEISLIETNHVLTFDQHKLDLIKNSYFKGSSNEEFEIFIMVCKHTGLDPIFKQIYPVSRWDQKLGKNITTYQTSIDGYRLIADRTGRYAPGRKPTYEYDDKGSLLSATAYIKKQTKDGTWHEIEATAFYKEYVQRKKDGTPNGMWVQMPHSQLAKCAEALAIRKCFPAELSKVYTKEEMDQADVVDITPQQVKPKVVLLTPEQIEVVEAIFLEAPELANKVFTHLKVNSVAEIPQQYYERIINNGTNKAKQAQVSEIYPSNDSNEEKYEEAIAS